MDVVLIILSYVAILYSIFYVYGKITDKKILKKTSVLRDRRGAGYEIILAIVALAAVGLTFMLTEPVVQVGYNWVFTQNTTYAQDSIDWGYSFYYLYPFIALFAVFFWGLISVQRRRSPYGEEP